MDSDSGHHEPILEYRCPPEARELIKKLADEIRELADCLSEVAKAFIAPIRDGAGLEVPDAAS